MTTDESTEQAVKILRAAALDELRPILERLESAVEALRVVTTLIEEGDEDVRG